MGTFREKEIIRVEKIKRHQFSPFAKHYVSHVDAVIIESTKDCTFLQTLETSRSRLNGYPVRLGEDRIALVLNGHQNTKGG